nr:platelet glycoprotein Ib alpha chain-like [Ipomoea batatas]
MWEAACNSNVLDGLQSGKEILALFRISVDGVGVPINCETTASISILANQLSSSSPCVSAGCGSVEGGTIEDGAVEDGAVEEDVGQPIPYRLACLGLDLKRVRPKEKIPQKIDGLVDDDLSKESLSKTTSVRREMADTIVEFDEIMAEIGNTRDEGEIIKTTFGNIAEMINVVSSSQHAPEESLLDDDDIFNQPSFLEAVSALEQAFLQTTKNYPTQPPRSHSPQQILTPSFDLIMFSTPTPQA